MIGPDRARRAPHTPLLLLILFVTKRERRRGDEHAAAWPRCASLTHVASRRCTQNDDPQGRSIGNRLLIGRTCLNGNKDPRLSILNCL